VLGDLPPISLEEISDSLSTPASADASVSVPRPGLA